MVLSGILLLPQEIQLWQTSLQLNEGEVQIFRALLSDDELARVERFKFDVHKRRFLVARGVLRTLLGQYLECDPRVIQFLYTQHGKPYLANTDLHFNISHSDEMAVYAFTRQAKIGVDIEKVEDVFKNDVAKRFFSHQEYQLLTALDGLEQQRGFD
jgi:4'-phosphopantetheinyl transferase